MIIDLIKTTWKTLIFIAIISLTITWAFNIPNTLLTTQTINEIEITTFNLYNYTQNISNAWNTTALNFKTILPPLEWQNITENILESEFWAKLLNNIAYIADWTYFPINFLLYILRWLSWLVTLLLALIGWNTMKDINGEYYSQLVMILNWVTQNLMIPYIQP